MTDKTKGGLIGPLRAENKCSRPNMRHFARQNYKRKLSIPNWADQIQTS